MYKRYGQRQADMTDVRFIEIRYMYTRYKNATIV